MTRFVMWLLLVATLELNSEAAAQQAPSAPGQPPDITTDQPATLQEPKPELERPTVWGEPTEVDIRVYVIDVDEVNSASQNFAASVYYQAKWTIPSLVHEGPGPLNRGLTEVWNPRLVIANLQQAWNAYPAFVEISPQGEVVHRQKVWGWFSQPLDLRDFPMDQQTLNIHLVAAGHLEKDVAVISTEEDFGRKSGIARHFSLPDFEVVSWKAGPKPYMAFENEPGSAGFQMQIVVRRNVTYYVMKVILPLCLIVIMSWIPRWIDPEQIGTDIAISTTAFLTLVAYLFAINVLLPRVSYVTRMDRFILLSTLIVFTSLLQTTVNTILVRQNKTSFAVRMDWWSRLVYPVILVVVLAVSFAV